MCVAVDGMEGGEVYMCVGVCVHIIICGNMCVHALLIVCVCVHCG